MLTLTVSGGGKKKGANETRIIVNWKLDFIFYLKSDTMMPVRVRFSNESCLISALK